MGLSKENLWASDPTKKRVSINTHLFRKVVRGNFLGFAKWIFTRTESFPVSNAPLGTQMSTMVDEIRVLSWKIEDREGEIQNLKKNIRFV